MKHTTTHKTILATALALMAASGAKAQCISGNCYDGYGVFLDEEKYRYTGFFDQGFPNGHGVLYYKSGDIYIGEFKDGKRNLEGTYYFADDGTRYIGFYKDGMMHGPIEEISTNGTTYHDVYKDNKPIDPAPTKGTIYGNSKNGYNVTLYEDGSQYKGYNRDNKHNGWGSLTKDDGSLYVGEFKDNMFNGFGTLHNPDGSITEGMWEDDRYIGELKNQTGCVSGDCKNSYSVLVKNGEKYIGEFKNGLPHGMGRYILPDGSHYTGSVVAGKIDGYGTLTYAPSDNPKAPQKYVGDLQNGKSNGYGAMFYQNGDFYYGHFEKNEYSGQGVYVEKATNKRKSGVYYKGELVKELSEQDFDLIFGDKDGYGLRLTEGGRYMGNLMNGVPEEQGTLETYDGISIYGEFTDGQANGLAMCEIDSSGAKYIGQVRDNQITGRGVMYYPNGTKKRGNFRNGECVQETAESKSTPKPEVTWTAPDQYNVNVTEGTYTVKLCVSSPVQIESVQLFVNGKSVVNKDARNATRRSNDLCDYIFPFDIQLNPGRNELVAVVTNKGGTTKTEGRYVSWVSSDAISKQKRVALVIGNGAYSGANVPPLRNPTNDAKLMSQELKALGFEVIERINVNRDEMKDAVYQFGDRLRETKAVGLFFYAGHGIQVDGINYLVPTSATLERKQDVENVCFSISKVIGQLAYAQNDLNIVILDACRDDPFAGSGQGGLAQFDAPKGTLIAYSTAPGKTAADGDGNNGLYTEQLAKAIKNPAYKIEDVFKQVRAEVYRISHDAVLNGKMKTEQIPWENSSIFGDFYFVR